MTAALIWLGGILARRPGRIVATATGVAIAVALLASIGAFLSATEAKMTQRAIERVPVDWQVEAQPGSNAGQVQSTTRVFPGVKAALPVGFAPTTGLAANAGGSSQTTGPGKVLGLPARYAKTYPGQVRTLAGRGDGVVLTQQPAATLRARRGDIVSIGRRGLPPARVHLDGVVDLPQADSLFQRSEEHTSELQSHDNLVCRLLLEKKKKHQSATRPGERRAGDAIAAHGL